MAPKRSDSPFSLQSTQERPSQFPLKIIRSASWFGFYAKSEQPMFGWPPADQYKRKRDNQRILFIRSTAVCKRPVTRYGACCAGRLQMRCHSWQGRETPEEAFQLIPKRPKVEPFLLQCVTFILPLDQPSHLQHPWRQGSFPRRAGVGLQWRSSQSSASESSSGREASPEWLLPEAGFAMSDGDTT